MYGIMVWVKDEDFRNVCDALYQISAITEIDVQEHYSEED